MNPEHFGRGVLITLAAVLIAGCTTLPADGGRSEVDDWVAAHRGSDAPRDERTAQQAIDAALRAPLDAESSVRIALSRNPDLLAAYSRLGVASAELYESGRLTNPRLSAALLESSVSGEQLTLGLVTRLVDLLLLPKRAKMGVLEFTQLKQDLAHEVLGVAADVERSYYRLVAARQLVQLRSLIVRAAEASATFSERLHAAGNISALALAQEKAAASQARLELLAMRSEFDAARAGHSRLLGLEPQTQFDVAAGLPMPLANSGSVEALVSLARDSRLDLAAARARTEFRANALGLTGARWVEGVEVGVEREKEPNGEKLSGPTVAVDLPLFNTGRGKVLRARSQLERTRAELAGLELDVAHQVRLAYAHEESARQRAEEYRVGLLPARAAIVARTQEEQNYMLTDQFQLLAAKAAEYDAYQGYVESVRDYWLARVELSAAVGTRLPGNTTPIDSPPIEVPADETQARPDDDHQHHSMTGGAP